MPWRKVFLSSLALVVICLAPITASAEGVIGVDTTFSITPIAFLTTNIDYAAAFNYFFTIEIFAGLIAFWLRITLRPFRM